MARVLIVEDQKKHLESLKHGLEVEGYEVLGALNGDEGFALAMTGGPIPRGIAFGP
jgi:DNA-binding response OmpR family regulator